MIVSFRHKGLERFWTRGDTSRLRPDWIAKVERKLDALELAHSPQDLAFLGAGFHGLRGDLKGRYALAVSRNWRLTFGWQGQDAVEVDLEDYHG
jgi:proteic killer suppression protein